MKLYFIKASYTGNVYKLSEFYSGNNYKLDENYMIDINFKPDDGTASVIVTNPSFDIKDHTHIIAPSAGKIYEIVGRLYINENQVQLILQDDPLIANYQILKDKQIQQNRTNDPSKFLGYNAVQDLAIRTEASIEAIPDNTNATGTWVLFTFQEDVINLEFEIGKIANYSTVGTFDSYSSLVAAFPNVDTSVPSQVPYFLKFAEVTSTNELYQAVFSDKDGEGVSWVAIHKNPTFAWAYNTSRINKAKYTSGIKVANLGDINTVQVAFPLDATLVVERILSNSTASLTRYFSIPSFNSIKGWNNPDKLLSIKLVPQELLGITEIERADGQRVTEVNVTLDDVPSAVVTPEIYLGKEIIESYINTESKNQSIENNPPNMTLFTVKQLKDTFTFNNWSYLIDAPDTYEPFKKYYLYFFGEMINIPARYVLSGFKVRLVVTSTGVIYEVYTDHMNIIGSGRLPWDTTYQVDQLDLFYASNPTYKEQFMLNQFSDLGKTTISGAFSGAIVGNPIVGMGAGFVGGAVDFGLSMWNRALTEKGMRDKADQIFGQNEVALTNIKGFDTYLVVITPEPLAYNQMINELKAIGWACSTVNTIDSLPAVNNTLYGTAKIVGGKVIGLVRDSFTTNDIDTKLQEGVVFISG